MAVVKQAVVPGEKIVIREETSRFVHMRPRRASDGEANALCAYRMLEKNPNLKSCLRFNEQNLKEDTIYCYFSIYETLKMFS